MNLLFLMLGPFVISLALLYWIAVAKSRGTLAMIAAVYLVACIFSPILYGWLAFKWPGEDPVEATCVVGLVLGMRIFDLFAFKGMDAFRGRWRELGFEKMQRDAAEWSSK